MNKAINLFTLTMKLSFESKLTNLNFKCRTHFRSLFNDTGYKIIIFKIHTYKKSCQILL